MASELGPIEAVRKHAAAILEHYIHDPDKGKRSFAPGTDEDPLNTPDYASSYLKKRYPDDFGHLGERQIQSALNRFLRERMGNVKVYDTTPPDRRPSRAGAETDRVTVEREIQLAPNDWLTLQIRTTDPRLQIVGASRLREEPIDLGGER